MRWLVVLGAVAVGGCVPRLYSSDPDGTATTVWEAPTNSWEILGPPEGLVAEGWAEGQVAPDVRLPDQYGEEVSLWQFYGNVVLVDVSAMWCGPCQALAEYTEETAEEYADQGFTYFTVMIQGPESDPGTVEDALRWAENYEIVSAPVVADGEESMWEAGVVPGALPIVLVLDREMKVASRITVYEDPVVRAAIEAEL